MDEVPNRTHDAKSNLDKMFLSKREKSRKSVSKFSLVNYKNIYYNDLLYDEYINNKEKERKYLQFEMLLLNMNGNLTITDTLNLFKSSSTILKCEYVDNSCIFYTLIKPALQPTMLGKSYSENVEPVELNAAKHPNNVLENRLPSFTNLFKRRSIFTITSCVQNTSLCNSEKVIIDEKQFLRETLLNNRKTLDNNEQTEIVNLNIHSSFCEFSGINFEYVSRKGRFKTNPAKEKNIELTLKNGNTELNCSDQFHIINKTSDGNGKITFFNCYKFKHNDVLRGRKLVFSKFKELGNILYINKKLDGKKPLTWFYIMYKKINDTIFIENRRIKESVRLKKQKITFQKRELNFKQDISNYIYKIAKYLIYFPLIHKANCNIIGWILGKIDQSMSFWNYNITNTAIKFSIYGLVKDCIGCNFISTDMRFLNSREKIIGYKNRKKQKTLQFSLEHQLLFSNTFDCGDYVKIESFIPEICVPTVITKRLKDVSSLKVKSVPLPCRSQSKKQRQKRNCKVKKNPSNDSQCCDGSIGSKPSRESSASRSSCCSGRKKRQRKPKKKCKTTKVCKKSSKYRCFRRSRSRGSSCSKGSRKSNSSTESCDSRKSKRKRVHKKKRPKKTKAPKQTGSCSDLSSKPSSLCSEKPSCSSVCQEVTKKTVSGWSKLCPCPCTPSCSKEGDRRGICRKKPPCKSSKPSCSTKFFAKLKATFNTCTPKAGKRQKQKCKAKRITINGKFRVTADYECGKIDIDVDKKSRKRLIDALNKFSDKK